MMKLLGYKKGKKKTDGKPYCILYVEKDFTLSEINNGAMGKTSVEVWLWDSACDVVNPQSVGCEVVPEYEFGSNGKPTVRAVSFKQIAK